MEICMVYLPIFALKTIQKKLNIPYMELMGMTYMEI